MVFCSFFEKEVWDGGVVFDNVLEYVFLDCLKVIVDCYIYGLYLIVFMRVSKIVDKEGVYF